MKSQISAMGITELKGFDLLELRGKRVFPQTLGHRETVFEVSCCVFAKLRHLMSRDH